jgi:hypothetical protein
MKTNYKLHLATSKDKLRPVMQSILVTKENIVATDAHIMAVVPTALVFNEASIECLPDNGLLIDAQIWKAIYSAESITVYLDGDAYKIAGHFNNKPSAEFRAETNGSIGNFPNWYQVIPTEDKREPMPAIGINAKLLMNLSDAIDASNGLKLETNGSQKGIIAKPIGLDTGEPYGLIMPIKIN